MGEGPVWMLCCLETIAEFNETFPLPFIDPEMPCETSFEPEFQLFVGIHFDHVSIVEGLWGKVQLGLRLSEPGTDDLGLGRRCPLLEPLPCEPLQCTLVRMARTQ